MESEVHEAELVFVYVIASAQGQVFSKFSQNCPSREATSAIWNTLKIQVKLILNCPRALGITCLSNKGQFFFFTKDNFQGLAVALTGLPVVINSSLYSVFGGKN